MALTDKLTAIANAIRSKTGETGKMTLDQMPTKIGAIENGGIPKLQEKSVLITTNGVTEVTPDSGQDGSSKVAITTSVPSIIRGSLSEVITIAFEILQKAKNGSLPATHGAVLNNEVPVFLLISVQGMVVRSWGSLSFFDDSLELLVWKSRVFSKDETGFSTDSWFQVLFTISQGIVNTDNCMVNISPDSSMSDYATVSKNDSSATITDWLD